MALMCVQTSVDITSFACTQTLFTSFFDTSDGREDQRELTMRLLNADFVRLRQGLQLPFAGQRSISSLHRRGGQQF
jgi:hypothetical protein